MNSKPCSSASAPELSARETVFKGWKAFEVRSGGLNVVFTPEIGGRVSGCSFKGRELFRTHPETEGAVVPRPASLEELKAGKIAAGFRFYGGSKTWLSPQDNWPEALPYFDLDSGAYECLIRTAAEELRVRLKSPVCRESGIQIEKEFVFRQGEPRVRIHYTMTNRSVRDASHGLWDVTELTRPGTVFMPLRKDSKFTRGVKVFETENKDAASVLGRVRCADGFAAVSCDDSVIFKVGTDSEEGWLAGFVPADQGRWIVFTKTAQIFAGKPGGHGCAAEIFNSDTRPNFEMEVHSPLVRLGPGESFSWQGEWRFAEAAKLPETRKELESFIRT